MPTRLIEALHRAFVAFGQLQAWRAAGLLAVMLLSLFLAGFYLYSSYESHHPKDASEEIARERNIARSAVAKQKQLEADLARQKSAADETEAKLRKELQASHTETRKVPQLQSRECRVSNDEAANSLDPQAVLEVICESSAGKEIVGRVKRGDLIGHDRIELASDVEIGLDTPPCGRVWYKVGKDEWSYEWFGPRSCWK